MGAASATKQLPTVRGEDRPAIIVGPDTLQMSAVLFRMEQDRCSYDTLANSAKAAVEIVGNEMEATVLLQYFGEEPPQSAVERRAAELPRVTHDSAVLACIQSIGDAEYFSSIFVRPTLVNPRLYARFYSDTSIHRDARDRIREIFEQLRHAPAVFFSYPFDTILVHRQTPEHPDELPDDQIPLVQVVLSKLPPHTLWPQIIESDVDVSIVMLDTVTPSIYRAFAIRIPKLPFDPWFRQYVKDHVRVTFLDKSLESDIKKQYPALWWLSK